jgi:hypothetical protein
MKQLRMGLVLAGGIAAFALSASAGASVLVSLVGDGNPDELKIVISGLGTVPATDVSAFDIGLNFSGLTLTAANMNLNLGVLDDGLGHFGSCGMGSDGSVATGGLFGSCPLSKPGGVTADLSFKSHDTDADLMGVQNPGSAANFSLTIATLDFSGAVLPSQVTMVWGDGIHNVKGASLCNPDGVTGLGNGLSPCIIYNPAPVPLPAALPLFGSGLLGLVGFFRRRRRQQALNDAG